MLKLLDTAEIAPTPWKNGGGITRGLSIGPENAGIGSFDWRITWADIDPGHFAFSSFPGVDRFTFVTGAGMSIERPHAASDAVAEAVVPFALLQVAGEETLQARLEGGSIRAFNLMVRRGVASGSAAVYRESVELVATFDVAVFLCVRGKATLIIVDQRQVTLQAGEAVEVKPEMAGAASLICDLPDTVVLAAMVVLRK